jgi:hypothetical protein
MGLAGPGGRRRVLRVHRAGLRPAAHAQRGWRQGECRRARTAGGRQSGGGKCAAGRLPDLRRRGSAGPRPARHQPAAGPVDARHRRPAVHRHAPAHRPGRRPARTAREKRSGPAARRGRHAGRGGHRLCGRDGGWPPAQASLDGARDGGPDARRPAQAAHRRGRARERLTRSPGLGGCVRMDAALLGRRRGLPRDRVPRGRGGRAMEGAADRLCGRPVRDAAAAHPGRARRDRGKHGRCPRGLRRPGGRPGRGAAVPAHHLLGRAAGGRHLLSVPAAAICPCGAGGRFCISVGRAGMLAAGPRGRAGSR